VGGGGGGWRPSGRAVCARVRLTGGDARRSTRIVPKLLHLMSLRGSEPRLGRNLRIEGLLAELRSGRAGDARRSASKSEASRWGGF